MTELEKELNRRADIIIRQEKQIEIDAEQIRALQKQNGELTDRVTENAELKHAIAELRREKDILNTHAKAQEKLAKYCGDQLTKAKGLLRAWFQYCIDTEGKTPLQIETAQFLEEIKNE